MIDGWKTCALEELGEIVGGSTPYTKNENYYGGDIPWITPKDLSILKERFISRGERNITIDGLNSCSTRIMPPHSVLFTSRAPIGYVAIALNELCTNQGFKSIIPNNETYYMFLYYLLLYNRDKIDNMGSGTTFKEISGSVMKNIDVYIPTDIEEQKKIASILSALDDKIELNKKINKTLEEMAKAIFKSWFVDFEPWGGKMPDDWKEGNLIDIANIVMGQSPEGASYNKNGIGTVFYQGRAEFGFRYPKRNLFTVKPKRIASEDDVLMSVRAPVGDFNIAFERCCIGRGLASIRSINSYQSYIFYLMLTLRRRLDMFDCEGTVFGSINKNSIENLPVIIPSDNIICVFEKLINPVDSVIKKNYIENIHLSSLRDTLLPKLMSGEIRVK